MVASSDVRLDGGCGDTVVGTVALVIGRVLKVMMMMVQLIHRIAKRSWASIARYRCM